MVLGLPPPLWHELGNLSPLGQLLAGLVAETPPEITEMRRIWTQTHSHLSFILKQITILSYIILYYTILYYIMIYFILFHYFIYIYV